MAHRYEQKIVAYTQEIMNYDEVTEAYGGEQGFIEFLSGEWLPQIPNSVVRGYADQGVAGKPDTVSPGSITGYIPNTKAGYLLR